MHTQAMWAIKHAKQRASGKVKAYPELHTIITIITLVATAAKRFKTKTNINVNVNISVYVEDN